MGPTHSQHLCVELHVRHHAAAAPAVLAAAPFAPPVADGPVQAKPSPTHDTQAVVVHSDVQSVACTAAVVAGEGAVNSAAGVVAFAAAAAAAADAPPAAQDYALDWMDSELAPAALQIHEYSLVSKRDYCLAMHMFLALVLQQPHSNWVRS